MTGDRKNDKEPSDILRERESRNLPTPLVSHTAIDVLQPIKYLPESWSLGWVLTPALLNQPVKQSWDQNFVPK